MKLVEHLKEALPKAEKIYVLSCESLDEKRLDIHYSKDWKSAIIWVNHHIAYFNIGSLHFTVDVTAKSYLDGRSNAEVFVASSFNELEKMLCYRYGGKGWEQVDPELAAWVSGSRLFKNLTHKHRRQVK
ncbi:MAG: hypothetical protein PHH14_01830 [Candidatus Margulisbacteria bacterium]|nr:hypothetical protein [Candidatus Margulisiibacteriota bacterium]